MAKTPIRVYRLKHFDWSPKANVLVLKKKVDKHDRPDEFWVYGKYLHVRFQVNSTNHDIQNSVYYPKASYGATSENEILKPIDKIRAVIYWE